jgi:hypothetical protein
MAGDGAKWLSSQTTKLSNDFMAERGGDSNAIEAKQSL